VGHHFDLQRARLKKYRKEYAEVPARSEYVSPHSVKIGILKCFTPLYATYVAACEELKLSYEVIDLTAEDWMERIERSGCDLFLFWPAVAYSHWKGLGDERIRILVEWMQKPVYPSFEAVWIHESKSRMHYWMRQHGVPHPKTWVFYNEEEALAFAEVCKLPVVFKSDLGSGASGVRVCRNRLDIKRLIRKTFGPGFRNWRQGPTDRQVGFIVFQEYVHVASEWRILRFGDALFGHAKKREGDFHSGTGIAEWSTPPPKLLEFAYMVTERGGFTGTDIDIFETESGHYLVNEIQAVFGSIRPYQMLVDGKPGMFMRTANAEWKFVEGMFCQNACSTLRVVDAVRKLGLDIQFPRYDGPMPSPD